MHFRGTVLLAAWTVATTAHADETSDLVAKGQELAKQGAWSQAITTFKQADAREPRAANACFIGLAYLRRELWAQAELYFARCHARANSHDPLPEWAAEAEQQLAAKLRDENVAAIAIDVVPADTHPSITITGFLPDEVLERGTIHLTPGDYTLTVKAPGYVDATRAIAIKDRSAQTVRVTLERPVVLAQPSKAPWIVLGAGVALGVAGTVIDVTKLQSLRDDLRASQASYDSHQASFNTWRDITVGMWIGGVVVAGVGAYLAIHSDVALSARLDRDGGAVLVGWRR